MRLAILDTETTGIDPSVHHVIEVAVTLYDVILRTPVESYSSLILGDTNEAEAINRIPPMALRFAREACHVWAEVDGFVGQADAVVAHKADFDRGFALPNLREEVQSVPWVCSKTDIEWPLGKLGEHLVHLALAHGVPVLTAHRAMADVDTLVRLFQKVAADGHDVPAMLARAMRPKTLMVSLAPYEEKDVVKSHGFSWNDLVPKQWARRMPFEDVAKLPFRVREASL